MKAILGIGTLMFLSLLLLGSGLFLHSVPAPSPAPAAHSAHGKGKGAVKTAPLPSANAENPLIFPLAAAGGLGLGVSALAALALSYSLRVPTPEAARRKRDADRLARQKEQEEYEARQEALQAQLSEAKQRKMETEALRDQVSRQFQEFFRTLPVPCFCFAATGRIIRWNGACEELYGIPAAAALESTLWDTIVPATEREDAEAKISRVLAGESVLGEERWDTVAGGGQAALRCSMVPLRDAEGQIIGGLSAGVDVTEFAALQQQVAALTLELEAAQAVQVQSTPVPDSPSERITSERITSERITANISLESVAELSGHPAFRARLAEEWDRAARYHAPLSLVLVDLDNFAARNRSFGFNAGDLALEATVAVIKSKIRTVDVLARLGPDEYAVILPETGEAGARVAAERLRAGISGVTPAGQPPLSACVGTALMTPEMAGAATLVARAQDALAAARSFGPGSVAHAQDLAASVSALPSPPRPRRSSVKAESVKPANV